MNPWDNAEIVDGPGPPSDSFKAAKAGLTAAQLNMLVAMLTKLAAYFEQGGECHRKVQDCLEVVWGLQALWARNRKQ